VLITGYFRDTADFDPTAGERLRTSNGNSDVFISRFTTAGVFEWAETWGGPLYDHGRAIAVTSEDMVYVAGSFYGTVDFKWGDGFDHRTSNGEADPFLVAFSGNDYQFVQTWGGSGFDLAWDVAVCPSDYVYVAGEFGGIDVDFDPTAGYAFRSSEGHSDAFVNILEGSSPYHFVDALTWGSTEHDRAYGVDADADGIYVSGCFNETVDFDPWGGYEPHTALGDEDAFLSHFASDLWHQWARTWGGAGEADDCGQGVAVDGSGNSYVCGAFQGLVDFDPGPGEDWHWHDGYRHSFLSKFPPDGNW
jgi:hypothetical protein